MARKRLRIGSVLEIPLSDGRKAYGQYVFKDERMGPLVQIFDLVADRELPIDELLAQLSDARPLFRPVITGLFAAVQAGVWKIVGQMPVGKFVYPEFISAMHENYEQLGHWFLWNGTRSIKLGRTLPPKYKDLEFLVVWSPHDIAKRIETGYNPYRKLIEST